MGDIQWEQKIIDGKPVMFTTQQAPGAITNGTQVEKVNSELGDDHEDGARAMVLGSLGPIDDPGLPCRYFYFVEWKNRLGFPVGVGSHRIREVEDNTVAFVTTDKWMREHGKLDPDDELVIAEATKGGRQVVFMTPRQMFEKMQQTEPEKFAELKKVMRPKSHRRALTMEDLVRLSIAGEETQRGFDARIGLRLTKEQAVMVRQWRVEGHYTWRSVARAAYPLLKCWDPPSNQLAGMSLCKFAALMFQENFTEEPWN